MANKMKNEFSIRKYPLKKVWLYSSLLTVGLIIFLVTWGSIDTLQIKGQGIVTKIFNRGGHWKGLGGKTLPSGIFAKVDDGTEIMLSIPLDLVKQGDHISKT